MAKSTDHLAALMAGLSHEKARLAAARSPREIASRSVWVAQLQKELAEELARHPVDQDIAALTVNELSSQLEV